MPTESIKMLRLPDVMAMTGLSKSAIYDDKTFPPSIKLGPRATAWTDASIQDWIRDRIKAPKVKAANRFTYNKRSAVIRFSSCTMTERVSGGVLELIFENGSQDGPCVVVGEKEIKEVYLTCQAMLRRVVSQ